MAQNRKKLAVLDYAKTKILDICGKKSLQCHGIITMQIFVAEVWMENNMGR